MFLKEKILGRQLEGRKFNYKEKFFYIISTNLLVYPLVDFYVNCFVRFLPNKRVNQNLIVHNSTVFIGD